MEVELTAFTGGNYMSYARSPQKFRLAVYKEPNLPRILIEGDSWTDHPLVSNLSWSLHLYLNNKAHILNISCSGDLIYNMSTGKQFKKLQAYLKSNALNFDLLFLSGGGNDILVNDNPKYKLSAIIKNGTGADPANYIKESSWKIAIERVENSYRRILDMTTKISPTLNIVAHTYDYIYPRNKGADVIVIPDVLGPWVWPVMNRKGIKDQSIQRDIIKLLLDRLKDMLTKLASEYSQLTVVNTLGTLPENPAWGINVPCWDDEIHPDSKGFAKLIQDRIGPEIDKLI
jgi:hypothetical protein